MPPLLKQQSLFAVTFLFATFSAFAQTSASKTPIDSSAPRVMTVASSAKKWPVLVAIGPTTTTVKWTCSASRDPKLTVSSEMRYEEKFELLDKERKPTKSVVPAMMAELVKCEMHQLEVTVTGTGKLKVL
jgi:hypothetical protein